MTMDGITASQAATWSIAAFATSGVILRPWGLPEAIWAVAGAALLVLLRAVCPGRTRSRPSARVSTSISS